jgi:signal transduction histidine kinase
MGMSRRTVFVYGLLAALWCLVLAWQFEEHARVRETAQADLRSRSKDIANTLGAIIRGMRWRLESRGVIPQDRIESVLKEMIGGRTNQAAVFSSQLLSIVLLNGSNSAVASAGRPIDLQREDLLREGEHWGKDSVILVNPVDLGAHLSSEGVSDTVILPPYSPPGPGSSNTPPGVPPFMPPRYGGSNSPGGFSPFGQPRPPGGPGPGPSGALSNAAPNSETNALFERPREPRGSSRRPYWARRMNEGFENRTLHGLALAMSTESLQAATSSDLWLRIIIMLLATVSVAGSGLAWRNLAKSSDLQIRLIRASELTSHLREMNLAAAGLAHETRNPLNIIRGLAQMTSKLPDIAPAVRQNSRDIVDQADKVAAQLNEFINYSRPREVRRSSVALHVVVGEVVRALGYDLEEKKIRLQVQGEPLLVEADEQLLRQALFNLVLNAIQAANGEGEITIVTLRRGASEAALEVRDNGPGVPAESRTEVFKPYFTTHTTGTGLGLAVVQQIVLAHGWEIECLPNTPTGAIFRISHLKVVD